MSYQVVFTEIALKNLKTYPANDQKLKALLTDAEKLEDYLDFLHIQRVKAQSPQRMTLDDVKRQLELS